MATNEVRAKAKTVGKELVSSNNASVEYISQEQAQDQIAEARRQAKLSGETGPAIDTSNLGEQPGVIAAQTQDNVVTTPSQDTGRKVTGGGGARAGSGTTTQDTSNLGNFEQSQQQDEYQSQTQQIQDEKASYKQQASLTISSYNQDISSVNPYVQYEVTGLDRSDPDRTMIIGGRELKGRLTEERDIVIQQYEEGMSELNVAERQARDYYSLGYSGFIGDVFTAISTGVERKQQSTDYPLIIEQIYDSPVSGEGFGANLLSSAGREVVETRFYSDKWATGTEEYANAVSRFQTSYQGTMSMSVDSDYMAGMYAETQPGRVVELMATRETSKRQIEQAVGLGIITFAAAPFVGFGVGALASQLPASVVKIGSYALTGVYAGQKAKEVKDVITGKVTPTAFLITTGAEAVTFAIGGKFIEAGYEWGSARWTNVNVVDYEAFIVKGTEDIGSEVTLKEYVKTSREGLFFTTTEEKLVSTKYNAPQTLETGATRWTGERWTFRPGQTSTNLIDVSGGIKLTGTSGTYKTPAQRTTEFVDIITTSSTPTVQDVYFQLGYDLVLSKIGQTEVARVRGATTLPEKSVFEYDIYKYGKDIYLTSGVSTDLSSQVSRFQGMVYDFTTPAQGPTEIKFVPSSTTFQVVDIMPPTATTQTRQISRVIKPFPTTTEELPKTSTKTYKPTIDLFTAQETKTGTTPTETYGYDVRLYDGYDTNVNLLSAPRITGFRQVSATDVNTILSLPTDYTQKQGTGFESDTKQITRPSITQVQPQSIKFKDILGLQSINMQGTGFESDTKQITRPSIKYAEIQISKFLTPTIPKQLPGLKPTPVSYPLQKKRKTKVKEFSIGYKKPKKKKKTKDFLALPDPISAEFEELQTGKPATVLKGKKFKEIWKKRLRSMGAGFTFPTAKQFKAGKGVKIK